MFIKKIYVPVSHSCKLINDASAEDCYCFGTVVSSGGSWYFHRRTEPKSFFLEWLLAAQSIKKVLTCDRLYRISCIVSCANTS